MGVKCCVLFAKTFFPCGYFNVYTIEAQGLILWYSALKPIDRGRTIIARVIHTAWTELMFNVFSFFSIM